MKNSFFRFPYTNTTLFCYYLIITYITNFLIYLAIYSYMKYIFPFIVKNVFRMNGITAKRPLRGVVYP